MKFFKKRKEKNDTALANADKKYQNIKVINFTQPSSSGASSPDAVFLESSSESHAASGPQEDVQAD